MTDIAANIASSIENVYVDSECADDEVTARVLRHFSSEQIIFQEPSMAKRGSLTPEQIDESKKNLHLTRFKGSFFKRCPGATQKKALTCCNYFVLNLGLQCNMDCSYCYLQSYLNTPRMTIYTNGQQAIEEMSQTAAAYPNHAYRVGTGEVIDSLSLDPLTLYSKDLIEFGNRFPKWMIEFKTKSDLVDQFLDQPHSRNVTVSWSINPEFVINSEELKTATLNQRITAAKKCLSKDFPIALHIDPIIYHHGWKENYAELIDTIFNDFSADDIQVISLGTLRFQPSQRQIMRRRFGAQSLVVQSEMQQSSGGKYRYDSSLRIEMYKFINQQISAKSQKVKTFICMETPESWIQSYSGLPAASEKLRSIFKPLPKAISASSKKESTPKIIDQY